MFVTVCLINVALLSLKLWKLRNRQGWRIRIPMPTISQTQFYSSLCLHPVLGPWALPFPILGLKCHTFAAILLFVLQPVLNITSKESAFLAHLKWVILSCEAKKASLFLLLFVLLLLVRVTVPRFQNWFPSRCTVALCVGYSGWKPADSTVLLCRQMGINF